MNLVILKYNAGNIRSVDYALQRLGIQAKITADKEEILSADKVIIPGVGEASTTMNYLRNEGLDKVITTLKQPTLGICLGMQLMCSHSEEGDVACLNIFEESVKLFRPLPGKKTITKVPHMGWNTLRSFKSVLFEGINEGDYVYFVHSYYVASGNDTAALCNYIQPFSAALQKDNFYAAQFHPEKSGQVGAKLLKNFIEKC